MARVLSLVRGLVSGYALLGVSVVYGLASVPLALAYLSKEEFGLWAMVMQFVGYLAMVDLGMSGSVGRLLIDYKEDPNAEKYGSLIATGGIVLLCQGLILFVLGYFLAPWFASVSRLPESLATSFVTLMRAQCLIAAIGFPVRIFSQILYAHQRLDIVNVGQIIFFVGGLASMWLGFALGVGVFSVLLPSAFGLLVTLGVTYAATKKLGLLPSLGGSWFQMSQAAEMFRYGCDIFLVALGTQLMVASQPLILSRNFGLAAVATWTVGTRVFGLVNQVIWRITDISAPTFAEMIVRGETAQLEQRYRQIAVVSASLAGWAAVTLCMVNALFIGIWTGDAVVWRASNDLLLGAWMISLTLIHSHNGFIMLTKEIAAMRWVYFLEGGAFVILAILLSRNVSDGIEVLLTLSVVTSMCCSGSYGAWRVSRYFRIPFWKVAGLWLVPMLQVIGIYGCASVFLWMALLNEPTAFRLIAHVLFAISFGLYVLVKVGIPSELRKEVDNRLRSRISLWRAGLGAH